MHAVARRVVQLEGTASHRSRPSIRRPGSQSRSCLPVPTRSVSRSTKRPRPTTGSPQPETTTPHHGPRADRSAGRGGDRATRGERPGFAQQGRVRIDDLERVLVRLEPAELEAPLRVALRPAARVALPRGCSRAGTGTRRTAPSDPCRAGRTATVTAGGCPAASTTIPARASGSRRRARRRVRRPAHRAVRVRSPLTPPAGSPRRPRTAQSPARDPRAGSETARARPSSVARFPSATKAPPPSCRRPRPCPRARRRPPARAHCRLVVTPLLALEIRRVS